MKPRNRLTITAIISAIMIIFASLQAEAAVVITIEQAGNDVLIAGGGTVDLTGLRLLSNSGSGFASMAPPDGDILVGPASVTDIDEYEANFTGQMEFGNGAAALASSGKGKMFGFFYQAHVLLVPHDYNSGEELGGSSIYANATLESLGVRPGSYTWTWGDPDSVTIEVIPPSAVPEPASLAILVLPLGIVLLAALARADLNRRGSVYYQGA